MRALPFLSGSFDAIYSMGTVEHFADTDGAVREIFRVVRPGGRVVIGVPNRWDPFLRPLLVVLLYRLGLYGYGFEKSYSRRTFRRMLTRAGFQVTAETGILFIPGWLRMLDLACYTWARPLSRLTGLAVAPFHHLSRWLPWLRRYGYLLATVAVRPAAAGAPSPQRVVMTTDPQTRPPDPPPSSGVLRFALTAGAWFIGLFGLMRLGWVERQILLPFAQLQERVADQLTGVQTDAVYVDASCSGGDAMALCLGAVLAFPATVVGAAARRRRRVAGDRGLQHRAHRQPVAAGGQPHRFSTSCMSTSGRPSSSWWRSPMCTPGCADRWDPPSSGAGPDPGVAWQGPCPAVSTAHRRGHRRLFCGDWVGVRERAAAHVGRAGWP